MTVGYFLIAIPTPTPVPSLALYLAMTCGGLLVIAFGNGLFKGNLQALVGQMYDNNEYSAKRDTGFQIFYMFINIGGFFAPFVAIGVRNWWLKLHHLAYNSDLPALCHGFLQGQSVARSHRTSPGTGRRGERRNGSRRYGRFRQHYLDVFNTGFPLRFRSRHRSHADLPDDLHRQQTSVPRSGPKAAPKKDGGASAAETIAPIDAKEIKQRLYALFSVFAVVIFFWFSFHQNGITLTFFANDYTNLSAIDINLGFTRLVGAEIFQSINPFFVVFLTPIVIGLFGWLAGPGQRTLDPEEDRHRHGYRRLRIHRHGSGIVRPAHLR